MNLVLLETRFFTSRVVELLDSETYRKLQNALLEDPDAGAVVPGCGGLRKIRVASTGRQKGKRSGCRVIYLHVPERRHLYFVAIYGKNVQEGLTELDKKNYRRIVDQIRKEATKR